MNGPEEPNDSNQKNTPRFDFGKNRFALIVLVSLGVLFVLMFASGEREAAVEISYSTFLGRVEAGQVEMVEILDANEVRGRFRSVGAAEQTFRSTIPYYHEDLMRILIDSGVSVTGGGRPVSPIRIVLQFLPWVIGFGFIWYMFRQMQGSGSKAFSFGKSKAKRYVESSKRIMFADVAGQYEAKYELQEVVEFLKNPAKFSRIGAKIPKGVLLVGRPGTGKTLLARAIAGEANVAFFHMSGSDFVEMFVGVGASRVRDLFDQGRKNSPCILFIDELDAVGRTRGAGYGGGHDEREQTLNQMLVEMDGFETKDGVIVLAATNRPDVLDPALLRPGRFDRQIVVDLPDVREREAILQIHSKSLPIAENVDLHRIARGTPGTSGADLANLVNEAALFAARSDKNVIEMQHFEEGRDKMLLGIARISRAISPEEKRATAVHESGHALLHYHLAHADPLHKVTVIPHGRALGLAISLPEKEVFSQKRSWILDRVKIAMGGLVAERIVYAETSTGSSNDIEQATELARKMVCEWGMSDLLGPVAFGQEDEPIFLGKEIARHKDYSEETAQKIDREVISIITSCMTEVESILTDNQDQLLKLADSLVERETLDDAQIRKLFNVPAKKDPAD